MDIALPLDNKAKILSPSQAYPLPLPQAYGPPATHSVPSSSIDKGCQSLRASGGEPAQLIDSEGAQWGH
ncbi:hypothetical protein NW754_014786 [Fusarium falciforme]|nr:hypothetical protein NW754_014786 [Fusarium falciforme]